MAEGNLLIDDTWTPTPENINALPDPLRRYIRDLATLQDPAGIVRQNIILKEQNRMLRWECERLARLAGIDFESSGEPIHPLTAV